MSKRLSAKYKVDRALGVNLWGRPRSPINKRNTRPGQHPARRGKLSDYGQQLQAKQRLRFYYGNIGEKKFRAYYEEAIRRRGDSAEILIQLLERRLDTVVYRMKFAMTVFAARQLVNHGHVLVNGQRVNIASYQIKEGDVIALRPKAKQMATVMEAAQTAERDVPDYVSVDHKDMQGTFVRTPQFLDVPYPVQMEPNVVIEYYSH